MLFTVLIAIQCISLVQVHGLCLYGSPSQLRVALRGPNAVTVSWRTTGTAGFNDIPKPQVEYSTSSTLLNKLQSQVGTTRNYNIFSFFHDVPLLNLAPSTTYYYRIASTSLGACGSNIRTFTTPPAVGSSNAINITFVADLGTDNLINGGGASRTMAALRRVAANTDFFVHSGDIAYADDYGLLLPFDFYESTWNAWADDMEEVTANNIYMTAPGNHDVTCFQLSDAVCPSNYKNFSAYFNRFRMPGPESGGYQNLWYSFDYGLVHVVVINTETDFPQAPSGPGTTLNGGNFQGVTGQLNWLQNDLQNANANRAHVPWIIVTGHRPFYGSLPKLPALPGNCAACAAVFQSLFIQYNVDIYMCGHVHWYERLYPVDVNGNVVANDYNNSSGVIHVTNGAGGAPEGAAQIDTTVSASAKIVTGFGYTRLQLKDASNARLSFFSSDSNQELDAINIVRNH